MTCTISLSSRALDNRNARRPPANRLMTWIGLFGARRRRRQALRILLALDDAILRDVGVERREIDAALKRKT